MAKVPALPSSLPGSELMPYMTARRRNGICDQVFEMIGDIEALADWARQNRGEFYTKLWGKGLPSQTAVEHSIDKESVESFWDRVEAAEKAKVIEGSATEVAKTDAIDAEYIEEGV